MGFETRGRIVGLVTRLSGFRVQMGALVFLLAQMRGADVLLQCRMFAEHFSTRRIVCTMKLALVSLDMSLQPRGIGERLATVRPIACMLADVLVLISDVTVDVGLALEGLVAVIERTGERTFICVGTEMLFQATGAIEGPVATLVGAMVRRAMRLRFLRRNRGRRSIGGRGVIVSRRALVARDGRRD